MGSHLFTSRSGSNLGIRMRKKPTYLYKYDGSSCAQATSHGLENIPTLLYYWTLCTGGEIDLQYDGSSCAQATSHGLENIPILLLDSVYRG
jgi:hypothetical protein